nr:midnolin homolog [Leptinotarsa decemlineata]
MENSSQSSTNPIPQGCGPNTQIKIHVSPTTGGDFFLCVDSDITIDNLKKLVSKRLRVPRNRICLLFRDKQLQGGNLVQNGISDGSRITLLPNVETGLMAHRSETSILQALESLNDTQVNEFLCGKAPLNLSMRLGDHMMVIQLQLSTISSVKSTSSSGGSASSSPSSSGTPTAGPSQPRPSSPPSLLQASRNLQHTLRKLSSDVFSGKDRRIRKDGIYSGTFSGSLNPALQDRKGRPRRDISTIVHILNDLLCTVPEIRRVHLNGSESSDSASPDERPDVPISVAEPMPEAQPMSIDDPSTIEDQNLRTRGKLEHLRLVMGKRRERRRLRRQKPYSLPQSDTDSQVTA